MRWRRSVCLLPNVTESNLSKAKDLVVTAGYSIFRCLDMRAGISALQLQKMLESAFRPLSCDCALSADGTLTIKLYEVCSGRVDLLVTGVHSSNLASSSAITKLIEELRSEIAACQGSLL